MPLMPLMIESSASISAETATAQTYNDMISFENELAVLGPSPVFVLVRGCGRPRLACHDLLHGRILPELGTRLKRAVMDNAVTPKLTKATIVLLGGQRVNYVALSVDAPR